jgi:hypothetical protein
MHQFSLSIHMLIDTKAYSIAWLLQIMLQKQGCVGVSIECWLIICDITLDTRYNLVSLGHMIVLFLASWGDFIPLSVVGFINLQFQKECKRILFSSHHLQHLLLFVFFMIVIMTGMRWNHDVVLIFMSFMDTMLLFFHVFAGHLYFIWKLTIQFICPLVNWFICSFGIYVLSSLYILDNNLLPDE